MAPSRASLEELLALAGEPEDVDAVRFPETPMHAPFSCSVERFHGSLDLPIGPEDVVDAARVPETPMQAPFSCSVERFQGSLDLLVGPEIWVPRLLGSPANSVPRDCSKPKVRLSGKQPAEQNAVCQRATRSEAAHENCTALVRQSSADEVRSADAVPGSVAIANVTGSSLTSDTCLGPRDSLWVLSENLALTPVKRKRVRGGVDRLRLRGFEPIVVSLDDLGGKIETHRRRPRRTCFPPLQRWRNERIIYERPAGSSLPQVKGVVLNAAGEISTEDNELESTTPLALSNVTEAT